MNRRRTLAIITIVLFVSAALYILSEDNYYVWTRGEVVNMKYRMDSTGHKTTITLKWKDSTKTVCNYN